MLGMTELPALTLSFALGSHLRGPQNPFELVPPLALLDQQLFDWPWSPDEWENSLHDRDSYALAALTGPQGPRGLALFHVPDRQGVAHVLKFLLCPEYRGRGIAERFLKLCHEELKVVGVTGLYLEVEESNQAAVKLYRKCGLQILVLKKNFYGTGRHGLAMGTVPQSE